MHEEQSSESEISKVFVSYSRRDREQAQRISDVLRERQFSVFRDTEDILPTEEWKTRLEQLIAEADTVVFLLSPNSAVSEVCAWEIEYAVSLGKRIAPIVITDVEPTLIPPKLARLNFIFATDRDPFENAIKSLVSALNLDIDWIREHTRLCGLSLRWHKAGRPNHLLLRGQDISDAENWRDTRPAEAPAVTSLQADLITQSVRATARRQRMVVVGSIVGLVGALALSAFAWLQSIEADTQRIAAENQLRAAQINESRFLAKRSAELVEMGDFTAAAQVALKALPAPDRDRPVTPAAESALRNALSNMTEVAVLAPVGDGFSNGAISPDGTYAVQSNMTDRAVVTDLRSLETVIDRKAPSKDISYAFTPDSSILRIARRKGNNSEDGFVTELWDLERKTQISSFDGFYKALSPDGRFAVVLKGESYNYQIVILDTATHETRQVLAENVQSMDNFSFDRTGDWLLMNGRLDVADTQGSYLANLPTGTIRQLDLLSQGVRWAGNRTTLLSSNFVGVDEEKTIELWEAPYDAPAKTILSGTSGNVGNIYLSPDAGHVSAVVDEEQVILDINTGEVLHRLGEDQRIAILPGSETFVVIGGTSTGIEFHGLSQSGFLDRVWALGLSLQQISFTDDYSRLVALGYDGSVHVWDIPEFISRPTSLANRFTRLTSPFDSQIRGVAFSSDGSTLFAHTGGHQNLVVADVSHPPTDGRGAYLGGVRGLPSEFFLDVPPDDRCGAERYLDNVIKQRGIDRPEDGVDKGWACPFMALSPSGNTIVRLHSRTAKYGVELQSTSGAIETVFLPADTAFMNQIRFSADGRFAMMTPQSGQNNGVVLVNLDQRQLVALENLEETIGTWRTQITSDGKRLIIPTNEGFGIWSTETGKIVGKVDENAVEIIPGFGPKTRGTYLFSDDRRLLLTSNRTGRIVDIETGETLVDGIAPRDMSGWIISPDETLVAIYNLTEQHLRIWDIEKGAFVARLSGMVTSTQNSELNGITAAAFSPSGDLIAAGSRNGRIRVWSYPKNLLELISTTHEKLSRTALVNELVLIGN